MLQFSSAQLDALIVAWFYPLVRVLAMLGSAPIFNSRAMPRNIRLAAGLAIGVAVAAAAIFLLAGRAPADRSVAGMVRQTEIRVARQFAKGEKQDVDLSHVRNVTGFRISDKGPGKYVIRAK